MDQDPPTIIQRGYADGEPVSPNIAQNIVLGALVGAFLAIAVVVITYLLNDTIMSADDVERKLGMNLLGTLPLEEEEDDGNKSSSRGIRRKKSEKKE